MARPVHPLRTWLDAQGLTYSQAAAIAKARGCRISAGFLQQIAGGFNGCSYPKAKGLAELLTEGAVSVEEIMEFPYASRAA